MLLDIFSTQRHRENCAFESVVFYFQFHRRAKRANQTGTTGFISSSEQESSAALRLCVPKNHRNANVSEFDPATAQMRLILGPLNLPAALSRVHSPGMTGFIFESDYVTGNRPIIEPVSPLAIAPESSAREEAEALFRMALTRFAP